MKRPILLLVTLCLFIAAAVNDAVAQPKTVFFTNNVLPPPNGMYISPAQFHAYYSAGVIITNVIHRGFTESLPPPPTGGSAVHFFNSEVDFDVSFNNGASFTHVSAPASVGVNIQALGGSVAFYDTEMLELNISGGTLPGGVMIRESPSLRSTGQTTVSGVPGGFLISSFFDVFTELSLDGGQTWSPSTQAGHVELRADPAQVQPVPEGSPLLPPPNDQYVTPAQFHAAYAAGIIITNARHKFFTSALNPLTVAVGTNKVTEQFGSTVELALSTDGGRTFNQASAPAQVTVSLQLANPGPPLIYDTEMLQLDVAGGDLPTGMRLRESPTRPSYGETSMLVNTDGTWQVSSFFDIFTELSTDGGQTWSPQSNGTAHVELQRPGLTYSFTTPNLPPTNGLYSFPSQVRFANGVVLSAISNANFSQTFAPPPPGANQLNSFNSLMSMNISFNGGQTSSNVTAPAFALIQISNSVNSGAAQYYNTEMLQLNISGGTLPAGVMVRESPTKASLGRAGLRQIPGANASWAIDSFFDVFTELSLDSGQTWNPAISPAAIPSLIPNTQPGIVPLHIVCPANITVFATGPKGAVVPPPLLLIANGDCPLLPLGSVTCNTPPGNLYPIGTTTVTCTGHNGCGEHPTCSFTVTVLPNYLVYAGFAHSALGQGILQPVGSSLTISNLGSSGLDGYHANLGNVSSVIINYQPFGPGTIQNTCVIHQVTFPYYTNRSIPVRTIYFGGTNPTVQADYSSMNVTSLLAQVVDESNHIVSASIIPNNSVIGINPLFPPCTNQNTTVYNFGQATDGSWMKFCRYGCNCIGTNCWIERTVCFWPIVTRLPFSLSALDVYAQGTPPPVSLTITNEQLGKFGNLHEIKGQATFDAETYSLSVNNVGSNGIDGVAVDLKNLSQFDMALAPLRLMNTGACLKLTATGQFNGQTNVNLGIATLSQSGGDEFLSVDFSSITSSMARVEVYSGTQLSGTATVPTGLLGGLTGGGNLIGCGKRPLPLPCFWLGFDSEFLFFISGASFAGNEIRILAANPAGQVQGLSQFCLQGCNLGQITIVGETNPPVIETDAFTYPQAQMTLSTSPGQTETVYLAGSATVNVMIGAGGQTGDSNNNNLGDASAQMTAMNLSGNSSLGPVSVTLDTTQLTLGMLEETVNNVPGFLDVMPFTPTGTANSFFDVWFDVQVAANTLHSAKPAHMSAVITHKPPAPGDTFSTPATQAPIDLLNSSGQSSGIQFLGGSFTPNCVPPKLGVVIAAGRKVTLCWPAACGTAFTLQCATNLNGGQTLWTPVTGQFTLTNGQYCITLDGSQTNRFYRIAR